MKLLGLMAVALVFLIGGCATSPELIPPQRVSTIPYVKMSCEELEKELILAQETLAIYEKKQRDNRKRDIILNSIVLVGSGAITSDHESEVAKAKGTVIAIESEIGQRCSKEKGGDDEV